MQPHSLSNISIAPRHSPSNRTPASILQPVQNIVNIQQNTIANILENNIQESR